MRKGNKNSVKRRSIMLPDSVVAEMAEIRERTGAQSDSEVLRRAFKLYQRLINTGDREKVIIEDIETGQQRQVELVS